MNEQYMRSWFEGMFDRVGKDLFRGRPKPPEPPRVFIVGDSGSVCHPDGKPLQAGDVKQGEIITVRLP